MPLSEASLKRARELLDDPLFFMPPMLHRALTDRIAAALDEAEERGFSAEQLRLRADGIFQEGARQFRDRAVALMRAWQVGRNDRPA